MVNSTRGGTFTPAQQTIVTGVSHSPHSSHHSTFSAGASPSTNSPTGSNSLTKIVVAQVYLLLSTIKEDKDRTKWEQQADQIRKLIDEHGMEVFQKGFIRLVVGNASTIFPKHSGRPVANAANYPILVGEMRKISHEVEQAGKIAESIETANEDIFRDFDLSDFMEHFKLDALEKTILALAFKTGSRSDLKAKADLILNKNFQEFLTSIVRPSPEHADMPPDFLASIIDRFVRFPPPFLNAQAKKSLDEHVRHRYTVQDTAIPAVVLSSLYQMRLVSENNPLVVQIQKIGAGFTSDEETCRNYIRNLGFSVDEHQATAALIYTAFSYTPKCSPSILISSLRAEVGASFRWQEVIGQLDRPDLRVGQDQLLALYHALKPLALDGIIDIQQLWAGQWQNAETQLSFISSFASLTPEQLDATTIPGLEFAFTAEEFANAEESVQERAAQAVRYPLVSVLALSAMFHVALHSPTASDTPEAKRLFQQVVVPNLDIFVVAAFGVPKPWPDLATDTIQNLFDRFLYKYDQNYDFVLEGLWRKDRQWVAARLVEAHAKAPMELLSILDHALRHGWLEDLVSIHNGFGLDLAAVANARGFLDLEAWSTKNMARHPDLAQSLLTFLSIKAGHEIEYQRQGVMHSIMLPVKTISQLLHILSDCMPTSPTQELILVQRACITAYPRLINYGEGFDSIIDANGAESNALPKEANAKMEEHYKAMYTEKLETRSIVDALDRYKHSHDPAEQDVFACMIHGLFDEYALYQTYPLEALASTAVLFGGIISHKLISDLPLEIALGMILESIRDSHPEESMYKFGLQALIQLYPRLPEWPGFCGQLLQIPGLRNTEAWRKVEAAFRAHQEEEARQNHHLVNGNGALNGDSDEASAPPPAPFNALYVDPPSQYLNSDPDEETQDKIQFVLNNITTENLNSKFAELKDVVTDETQQWFAGHLVRERARMQPNYHNLYLDLVKLFAKKSLWSEILRETYVNAFRALNSESTMQSQVDRSHLKNLAVWLGSLTLARDKPIKQKNIAFKQLLSEAYDSGRLLVVIPFVCKVLSQGQYSTIYKPPNPWVMEVVRGLIELYQRGDLKLNMKFEIEVLCSDLALDYKNIEPSDEIMNRVVPLDEIPENMASEGLDRFDNLSLNGMASGVGGGRFSPQDITSSIPDLGPMLIYPPTNDMVNQPRLQEIVRTAITRAVHEIISPVVERSVTIAAISTAQMIHKDFATEPNEARLRSAAVNMVKKTAGALALVTSKEPLRASMMNYIRGLSQELPQGLPEGTVIMCVNSNLDLACSQVEKKAEERAVPEIEEMIEHELEARRMHRMQSPNEPYVDPSLSRWSWTIPAPFKLQPNINGLNPEQMAIYDEFARQPRVAASIGGPAHIASSSDATRSMANEILQDQYPVVAPTQTETPAMAHINTRQVYPHPSTSVVNGRASALPIDPRALAEGVLKALDDLALVVSNIPQQHWADVPADTPTTNTVDGILQMVIESGSRPESYDMYIVDLICEKLFTTSGMHDVFVESLVYVLQIASKIKSHTANRITVLIAHQPGENLIRNVTLATSLIKADMLEWQRIDSEVSKAILLRNEDALQFLSSLIDLVLLNDRPVALYADFARSLEVAWQWIEEEPALEVGQQLKQKLTSSGLPQIVDRTNDDRLNARRDQMEYVFEEWVRLCTNPNATSKALNSFIAQMYNKQIINNRDDLLLFLRLCIDSSVDRFEQHIHNNGKAIDAYLPADSLAKLIAKLVKGHEQEGEVKADKASYLASILSLMVLVLNHHHVMRGELFNQKVFLRLFSTIFHEFDDLSDDLEETENQQILYAFADTLLELRPAYFPGFMFGWLALVTHRSFMPLLLSLPNQMGWSRFADIMESLMEYVGELFKPLQLTTASKEIYRGVIKLVVLLHHDFPDFLAVNHSKLSAGIPSHCIQLHNLILNANPAAYAKIPDPLQAGLKIDRLEEIRDSPEGLSDVETPLRDVGLLDILDQALENGPSEDAVAQISHAIQNQQKKDRQTGLGFVPINVDRKLIDSLVMYVGIQSIARAAQKGGATFAPGTPDVKLVFMLVHEINPEARYFFISSIVDQLRGPSNHTHYFSQALLELFDSDSSDLEELDIRQQVTRILLERLIGRWPQPWGLMATIHELVKNEKYQFFKLPFIEAEPEVSARFMALAQAGRA